MNDFGKASLLALALTVAGSTAAAAQECEIDEGRPSEVARALVSVTTASSAQRPDQKVRGLQQAVKQLTDNAARIEQANAAGRNFVLGKAYVLWMQQPDIGHKATRGQLGFSSSQQDTVDLLLAADSAFDAVTRLMPQCATMLEDWRQQQPWVELVNGAIQMINANQLDSAETLVRRSMILSEVNPYGPNLLATIAQAKGDFKTAIEMRRKTIELAQGDTTYDELRYESMYNLGALLGREAEEATDAAQKTAMAREAATLFQQFVAAQPNSPQAVSARAGVANMMMMAGDTSAVTTMYADQIANPRNYSDMQLVQAGVVAARAEKAADAAKLFEAALTVNQYNRDALYNLAASYWALNEFDKMFPLLTRLLQLDPSNPDNLRLVAYGYQGKQKAVTDAAQRRVLTDSIVKYVEQAEGLAQNVVVDDFSRGTTESSLGGRILNKGTTAKSFRLTVEFLNAQGQVVGTQEANVGPVNANAAGTFNLQVQQPNVVGWRYRVQS